MKLLFLTSVLTLSAVAQIAPETRSAIDQTVTKIIAKAGIASASIAIVKDGKLACASLWVCRPGIQEGRDAGHAVQNRL